MSLMRGQPSSLSAIAAILNTEGVPTTRGGRSWYPSTVREVLMHERSYCGDKRGESESRWPFVTARSPSSGRMHSSFST